MKNKIILFTCLMCGWTVGPARAAVQKGLPLTSPQCSDILTLAPMREVPRLPIARVTAEEIAAVDLVPEDVVAIEGFLKELFVFTIPSGEPHSWHSWFRALWRRIPEVIADPVNLPEHPTSGQIENEWRRFKRGLAFAPRSVGKPVPQSTSTTVPILIKFNPKIQAHIRTVDPILRARFEALPFDGLSILGLIFQLRPNLSVTQRGSADKMMNVIWKTFIGVGNARPWNFTKTEDIRETSGASGRNGDSARLAEMRLVEEIRLVKMIYNRNRF